MSNLANFDDITKKTENNNRYYLIDSTWLPSVTSIIKIINQDSINKWKTNIGIDNANIISKQAADRGTLVHSMCEQYLLKNSSFYSKLSNTIDNDSNNNDESIINYFNNAFIPCLNRITNIRALESVLFSKNYNFAGTVDCIAEFDNQLSIIDFKTSSKFKPKKYIPSYFIQTAAYALAYHEMTNILIENLVIIIGFNDSNTFQIYTENINNLAFYKPPFNSTFKSWKDTFIDLSKSFSDNNIQSS